MSAANQVFMLAVFGLGWIVAPVVLVWGWVRWVAQMKKWTLTSFLGFIGFLFATASALVAISSCVYARAIGGFAFYDPFLMRIFRLGTFLSLTGVVIGLGGVWRPHSLRWHSVISSIGTLAFWIGSAASE